MVHNKHSINIYFNEYNRKIGKGNEEAIEINGNRKNQ